MNDADLKLIVQAARKAGDLALEMLKSRFGIQSKPGGSPVTDIDHALDAMLARDLIAARPDYGWLSEETADNSERLNRRRVFVVDPIDGTTALIKRKPWFTVCVAVVEDGRPVAGCVHAPELGETYAAQVGGGATLNGAAIRASGQTALDGSRILAAPSQVPADWGAAVENRNSVALRMALIASGVFDAAVAPSGKSDWDLAAADVIATEAGAVVCDMDGRVFTYNRPVPRQEGLICAAPGLAPLILSRVRPIQTPL